MSDAYPVSINSDMADEQPLLSDERTPVTYGSKNDSSPSNNGTAPLPHDVATCRISTYDDSMSNTDSSSSDTQPAHGNIGVRESSNFSTIMHIIKGNIGTGVLAMPSAFTNAGILTGTLGIIILGIICIHCMHLLGHCSHYLCDKARKIKLDYSEVAEQSFKFAPAPLNYPRVPKIAKTVVNGFLMITQFGFCCVYILFVAQNIQLIIEKNNDSSPIVYEAILLLILIPYACVPQKYLAPFSIIANIASFVGLFIIIYYLLIKMELKNVDDLPLFVGWSKIPIYFGTAIYTFEGIGVVLPLENKMKDPSAFPSLFGVLNVGMVTVTILYITIGFYGYLQFGADAQPSITLNLSGWEGLTVQIIFVFCIFISYGLQFFVPMEIIGSRLSKTRLAQRVGPFLFDCLFRAVCVIGTFGIAAVAGKYLDLLISLIGAIASSALALIFPPILEIITFWPDRHERKFFWVMFVKDIAISVLGVVGFIAGTYVSLLGLISPDPDT